jgi:O-antigen/teichoic acid export membrane protein
MSRAITENIELAILKIRKVLVPGVTYVALAVCLASFLFSKLLILVMLGPKFLEAETAFQLMLFSLVANVLTNVFTLQLFIKLNFFKSYAGITQLSAFLSVVVTLVCALLFGLNGAAMAWLVNEFFLLAYSATQLQANGISVFHRQSLHPKQVLSLLRRQ